MRRAVRAEWTKLRTVPSTGWLALSLVALTVAVSGLVTLLADTSRCRPAAPECLEDTARLSLSGVHLGQIAEAVLGVLAVTAEYPTKLIHMTLAAHPRRGTVLAAKVTAVLAVALGAGVLAVLGSLLAGRLILPARGFTTVNGYPPLSLADGPTLRAAVGTMGYLSLLALLSLGIGTAVRDTAGALTTVLSLLFVPPIVATFVTNEHLGELLRRYAPMTAGLTMQATRRLDALPIGPWAGLGLFAGYAAGALALGYLLFRLRDA